jgi:CheY-like chemotaxis protein
MWSLFKSAKPTYSPFDFDRSKRSCRIVVIDDDNLAIPVDQLLNDGYNIAQLLEVDANAMRLCEQCTYDIILLDYNGVAPPEITPDDGFGVFQRIRQRNPDQYIIAISGKAFDIAKTAYLKEANDWLKKPVSLADTKAKLDKAITACFDKEHVLNEIRLRALAQGLDAKTAEKLVTKLKTASGKDSKEYYNITKGIVSDVNTFAGLIERLIKIAVALI